MSSLRSRSGGRRTSTVLRRNNRSWRNLPAVASAWISEFVAEMTRTLTRCVLEEPTRSNSPVSSTRNSFACCGSGRFAISSRNRVPPSASSNRPTRSSFASVKAPFTDAKLDRVGRFELAEGGTLFLDEIANLPLPQQAKLLRVLETGEFERVGSSKTQRVNVRVISATNSDIRAEATAGRFRQDLLFRLNTVELRLPPLRERREDIPLLAGHFGRRHAARYRKRISGFTADAMQALRTYPWPGNVRELDHTIERAVLMAEDSSVRAHDLGLGTGANGATPLDLMSLEDVERVLIQKALARASGNVTDAAKALGLSRSALYRRLKRHGF